MNINKKFRILRVLEKRKRKAILKLVQWHLDQQWMEIKEFAESEGITLIGITFLCIKDSADV